MTANPSTGSRISTSAETTTPLILDLLAWLAPAPRPYTEVMEAWRTSCPRLPIWEDAIEAGLVERRFERADPAPMVVLTPRGRQMLAG